MAIAVAGPGMHPLHLALTVFLSQFARERNQKPNFTSGCEGLETRFANKGNWSCKRFPL